MNADELRRLADGAVTEGVNLAYVERMRGALYAASARLRDLEEPDPAEAAVRADAVSVALGDVASETIRALAKWAPFNSAHEGWAVIREELDELWEHVRANSGGSEEARVEAVQIAAMAVRYAAELCS